MLSDQLPPHLVDINTNTYTNLDKARVDNSLSRIVSRSFMKIGIIMSPNGGTRVQFTVKVPKYMFDICYTSSVIGPWSMHPHYKVKTTQLSVNGVNEVVMDNNIYVTCYAYLQLMPGEAFNAAMIFRREMMKTFSLYKPINYNHRTKAKPRLIEHPISLGTKDLYF